MNSIKILIVEDESIVALDIKKALQKLNYNVVAIAKNYKMAMEQFKKYKPSIVFMDIHLNNSKKDGIETVKDIQKIEHVPIIYLTAFSDETTLKRAIHTNPVSYLVKPFKMEELKSTILLAQHKMNHSNHPEIDEYCTALGFGYYYNRKDEILFYENIYIKLSVNEKKLLNILLDAKGAIVSNTNLEHMLWPNEPVSRSSLRTLIYRLRSKLEHKLVETVHSAGCRLTPHY
jgi:DNA-binding response OmpR family regulator